MIGRIKMSRRSDINMLMADCEIKYKKIKNKYNEALRNKSLDLRIPVKNLMENLRSSLDYMAHDIYEHICKPDRIAKGLSDPKNIYFPYSKKAVDFPSRISSSFPNLKILSSSVYSHIESIQPFRCGDSWLYDLCRILNENKHDRLVPQERKETEIYTVSGQHGSISIYKNPGTNITSKPGAVKIMGVPSEFKGDHVITNSKGQLKHKLIKWVAFNFEGTSINIIALLDKSVPKIKIFADFLYTIL